MYNYPYIEQFYKDNFSKLLDWGSPLRPSKSCPKNGAAGVAKFLDFYKKTGLRSFTEDEVLTIINAKEVEDGDTIFHQNIRVMRELKFVKASDNDSKKYVFTDQFVSFADSNHTVDCYIIEKLMSLSSVDDLTMYFNFLICVMREAAIYGHVIQYRDSADKFALDVSDEQKRKEHQTRIYQIYGFKGDEARNVPENYTPNISYFCHAVLRQLGILEKSDVRIDNMGTLVLTPLGELILKKIDENLQNVQQKSPDWKGGINNGFSIPKSLQQIFYGAPGTGKSNKIKEDVDDQGKIHYRTTFHPDSDYSTFVGCYKPISHKKNMLAGNGINETQLLSNFFNSNGDDYKGKNKARYLYEALVHTKDIRDLGLDAQMVADKLIAKGFTGCAYTTEANCMYNIYDWLKEDGYIVENKLSYEFIPQTFTKAYVDAWKNQKSGTPVYLIIEEINRGNCAQIFGDLFQLLDRDDEGYSRYEVSPDSDLEDYIASLGLDISGIKNSKGEDISSQIANGKLLKLPNNMYIWATMNTSDQSLFPIDSAFKRRWDWKYIPIDTRKEEWNINVGGSLYSWTAFLEKINNDILTDETAEDKHLGFYFCKADNKEINAEKFVGKVLFYLWNDVFKVYGIPATIGSSKDWAYTKFYNTDGSVDEQKVKELMKKLDIPALGEETDNAEEQGNE